MHSLPEIPVKKWIDEFLANKEYNATTSLCAIMTSFGSDKGNDWHNYTTLYSKLFTPWKNQPIHLFELGLGTNFTDIPSNMGPHGHPGASLYGWSLFFPHAYIYGADIDKRVLFDEQKIKTYYCDQCDAQSIREMFQQKDLKDLSFDIIIEDGLHEFSANINFLLNSINVLRKGGIYIAEDLDNISKEAFLKVLPQLKEALDLKSIDVVSIPCNLNHFDNTLLIIQK